MSNLTRKIFYDITSYMFGNKDFGLNQKALSCTAYPVDLNFTLERKQDYYSPLDEKGIPVKKYRSVGLQYNPTRIAAYGLAHFNRFLDKRDDSNLANFMKVVDWFMIPEDGVWRYNFNWEDLKAPWISCMAQGEGISILVRAYHLTGNHDYIEQSLRALRPFQKLCDDGGVRSHIDGKWPFLEEYPARSPIHVLNGFLYALIGISDLAYLQPEVYKLVDFKGLVESLRTNLKKWDLGYWSAYDLSLGNGIRNAATVSYHRLHVTQLRYLGTKFNLNDILLVADKWERMSNCTLSRIRAFQTKSLYRMKVHAQR